MIRAIRALGTIAAAVAAAIVVSAPVLAHSGEWGIFLDPAQSTPGGSVHLRGDVASTGPIQIVLVGADASGLVLGTIDDAPNGHFQTVVTFPPDVAPGIWAVEARADGMTPARIDVELSPAPPPGPDDRDDPMASPVLAPARPVVGSPLAPVPDPDTSPAGVDLVPIAAAALAVVGLALLLVRTRRSTAAR
jgi:hypothetical protein